MTHPGSVGLGESKLNLWRLGHFCTPLVETRTIVLKDILGLIRYKDQGYVVQKS